ncbi:hypothetical protein M513_12439 [Trichuris suis]|uniref:Uncharacterized protein n=1 Tax=Trichuris suis TaxID=68888 RepID=A0A085LNX5_9BILA|nr:hypothetical protein M513_12439 [Trichuris suis]
MTVVLVCRIPFEQFLTECGAKYEYTWRGGIQQVINNSAQLRANRRRVNDVMTVVLVCRIPFEQFLTECGAKYEYTWRGGIQQVINNSAQLRGNRRLENIKV